MGRNCKGFGLARRHEGTKIRVCTVLRKSPESLLTAGFACTGILGPGLLESAYEILLCESLKEKGLSVERQKIIPITFKGRVLDEAFRADIIVENQILIELKSTERFAPVHAKQVIAYLHLMDLPLGFLMNFGAATFKEGLKRLANNYFRS